VIREKTEGEGIGPKKAYLARNFIYKQFCEKKGKLLIREPGTGKVIGKWWSAKKREGVKPNGHIRFLMFWKKKKGGGMKKV